MTINGKDLAVSMLTATIDALQRGGMDDEVRDTITKQIIDLSTDSLNDLVFGLLNLAALGFVTQASVTRALAGQIEEQGLTDPLRLVQRIAPHLP